MNKTNNYVWLNFLCADKSLTDWLDCAFISYKFLIKQNNGNSRGGVWITFFTQYHADWLKGSRNHSYSDSNKVDEGMKKSGYKMLNVFRLHPYCAVVYFSTVIMEMVNRKNAMVHSNLILS